SRAQAMEPAGRDPGRACGAPAVGPVTLCSQKKSSPFRTIFSPAWGMGPWTMPEVECRARNYLGDYPYRPTAPTMPAQLFGLWPTRAANLDCRAAITRGGTRMLARHQRHAKQIELSVFGTARSHSAVDPHFPPPRQTYRPHHLAFG